LAPKLFLTIGKDFSAKSAYSGVIGNFNVNLGDGSYREGNNFEKGDDVFGIANKPDRPPIVGPDGIRPD
jgi:hypothetical protein